MPDALAESAQLKVNQYTLGKLLGSGAFGDVRLGSADDKEFAVKCLSRSFLKKQREFVKSGAGRPKIKTALDDVQREIAIMKKTEHENLVNLIEVIDDEVNDSLYIVLELVTGGQTMYFSGEKKAYFTKDGDVYDEDRAKSLCRDIIEGLRYLHAQGIIHRDLKPENLLLTDKGVCKIADFGIAQKLDIDTRESASITNMQGTHQFMSPEMITEKKYNGFLVDIWAFGVCLYCFVASELPFWGNSPDEVFDAITTHELHIPATLSEQLQNTLSHLLEKDPTKRYTMDTLVADPFFEIDSLETVEAIEPTEEERLNAITPKLEFAQVVSLKVKMNRWKKTASEKSKTFGKSELSLASDDQSSKASVIEEEDFEKESSASIARPAEVEIAIEDTKEKSPEKKEKKEKNDKKEEEASQKTEKEQTAVSEEKASKQQAGSDRSSNGCCSLL